MPRGRNRRAGHRGARSCVSAYADFMPPCRQLSADVGGRCAGRCGRQRQSVSGGTRQGCARGATQRARPAASDVKMTKVVHPLTKQSSFEVLKTAMEEIGVTGMTVSQVLGCGMQKGRPEYYRGVAVEMNLLPEGAGGHRGLQDSRSHGYRHGQEGAVLPGTSATARSSSTTWRTSSRCAPAKRATTRCRTWNKSNKTWGGSAKLPPLFMWN